MMSKNTNSLKVCSTVNFSLGFGFWSKLCTSLMLPHEHFQDVKQSSRYIFYDINLVLILFLHTFFMISDGFSSSYA